MNKNSRLAAALLIAVSLFPCAASAGFPVTVSYDGGIRSATEDRSTFELALGGLLQTDYRNYFDNAIGDDRFDVRRARFALSGAFFQQYRYRFEYEFQGNDGRNLLDGYLEYAAVPWLVARVGQFKEPFGLEAQTADRNLFFAERSIGYSLVPWRDVGAMLYGEILGGALLYGVGAFNGDGTDGSTRGSDNDTPEYCGRVVGAPLAWTGVPAVRSLFVGVSAVTADIDLADVTLDVKSTGMVGTSRSRHVLNANTKFGVLQDAGRRWRLGAEAEWAWGPAALQGEAVHLRYTDLKPAGGARADADFSAWYASAVVLLTGESPSYRGGALQPINPARNFVPGGGWGALAAAVRVEGFRGDDDWITPGAYVSTAKARAWSVGLTWILNPLLRLTTDYTRTTFSDPIKSRVRTDGSVDYIEKEGVFTTRAQFSF